MQLRSIPVGLHPKLGNLAIEPLFGDRHAPDGRSHMESLLGERHSQAASTTAFCFLRASTPSIQKTSRAIQTIEKPISFVVVKASL